MGRNYRWIANLNGPTRAEQGFASGTTRGDDTRTSDYTPADAESDVRDFLAAEAPNSKATIAVKEV